MHFKSLSRILFITAACLVVCSHAAAGIRCGNDIIDTGNTKMQVTVKLQHCGEVLDKDTQKKEITQGEIKTEEIVETWYVRIKERGNVYCYPLNFVDGTLDTIGKWTRCN